MADGTDIDLAIDNEAMRFPAQMVLVRDVFSFSFSAMAECSHLMTSVADICTQLDRLTASVRDSVLPEDEAERLIDLLCEEIEVLSYSIRSRNSVIPL